MRGPKLPVVDPDGACPPGTCEITSNHQGIRYCSVCGFTTQTLTCGRKRHPLPGDYRVVCEGPLHDKENTACPIGPSEASPLVGGAVEKLRDHQAAATELYHWCEKCELAIPGIAHRVKITQF